jgi:XRE family transcriptional regulator, aerobic/anaerobic benzoate catabolism transcriptional regulator
MSHASRPPSSPPGQPVKHGTVIAAIGRRVRQAREDAGLSVTETARRAGLSRRFLTLLEGGHANVSVARLAALASALDTPLRELCDVDVSSAPALRVALLGLRGAGKSTVGRLLAQRLEVPFFELDALIEERAGMPLRTVFDTYGESFYREQQLGALEGWLAQHGSGVLATGGSLVMDAAAFARLRGTCRTVWLRAAPEEHFQRVVDQGDLRPIAGRSRAMTELKAILAAREPLYAQAERTVETSGRAAEKVSAEIAAWLTEEAEERPRAARQPGG